MASRTKFAIYNTVASIITTLILGFLSFLRAKYFIAELSTDIYSLNQLYQQIFTYIALADIGFTAVILHRLYKSHAKQDKKEISAIYSTSKRFFAILGAVMFGISVIVCLFIQIFTKADVPVWYMQAMFLTFAIKNVIDYFFIAPRLVAETAQQKYKWLYIWQLGRAVEIVVQIIMVLMGIDFIIVLAAGIPINILFGLIINLRLKKAYPWLKDGKKLNKEHLTGTKHVIPQRIADAIYYGSDVIIISAFINPMAVVIYTSYNMVTKFVSDLMASFITAITPGYANVANQKDAGKRLSVFNEISTLSAYLASIIGATLFALLNPFVALWIGEQYIVEPWIVMLFILILYRTINIRPLTMLRNSLGLFKATKWPTLIEALLNIILSIILGIFYGLPGVLVATLLSTLLSTFWFLPWYSYREIFKKSSAGYFLRYAVNLGTLLAVCAVIHFMPISADNFGILILLGIATVLAALIFFTLFYAATSQAFRLSLSRVKWLIRRKK